MKRQAAYCFIVSFALLFFLKPVQAQPGNDSCANAFILPVNSSFSYDTYTAASATSDLTGCGDAEDVWFKFKVPANGLFEIQTQKYLSTYDAYFRLYEGVCGSLTAYACTGKCNYYSTSNCGAYLRVNDTSLAGDTVYLRVSNRYNFGTIDSFKIAIREMSQSDVPVNDTCGSAALLAVGSSVDYDTSSFEYALVESSATLCSDKKDVWFKFAVPASGRFILSTSNYNNQYEPYCRIYTGTCGSLSEYACTGTCHYYSTGNCGSYLRVIDPTLANDTLYIQVGNRYTFGTLDSFLISVHELGASDVCTNDSCGAAQLITTNSTFQYDTSTFKYALAESSLATCNDDEDVWFKMKVPASGFFELKTLEYNNQYEAYFRIYTGSCASLTAYDCSSNCNYSSTSNCGAYLNVVDTSLANDTILIRVSNRYSFGTIDSFMIAAKSIPPMRTDTGSYEVTSGCPSLSGSQWVDFLDNNSKLLFSINPKGESLGTVCWGARVWDQSANLRTAVDTNGKTSYLMHRNFYVNPSSSPGDPVSVRLYLRKSSVKAFRDSLVARGFSCGSSLEEFYTDSLIISKFDGNTLTTFSGTNPVAVSYTVTLLDDSLLIYEFSVSSFSQFVPHFTPGAPNAPLPVVLINFTGTKVGEEVRLNWSTTSEINNSHFEIERASATSDFITIGTVKGHGNSSEIISYSFIDPFPQPGLNIYRLRQVDFDGTEELSNMVTIDGFKRLILTPNPAPHFVFNPYAGQKLSRFTLHNTNGQMLMDLALINEEKVIFLDADIPEGLYIASFHHQGRWYRHRLFISND